MFDSWVGKIPWRRKWQPSPVFLRGKAFGQKTQWDIIHGVTRVGHHFATKPPPPTWYTLNHRYDFLRQQDLFKSSYVYSV